MDHKQLVHQLVKAGLSWDNAAIAVGVLCEQTDIAYQQGFKAGYNTGYEKAKQKFAANTKPDDT